MIPMSNCRISVVLMSDCTTVKTRQKRTYSRKTYPEFTSSIRDPRSLAIMVASKQQQRVALVLLITCLDNKRKNEDDVCGASHGWAKEDFMDFQFYSANFVIRV